MVFKHFQDEVERFNARTRKEFQDKEIPTRLKWFSFKQQFFASALIAGDYFTNGFFRSTKFEDETNLRCHLLIDHSRSMGYSSGEYTKSQYAGTLAATLAYFLFTQGDAVGLATFDDQIRLC